MTVYKITAIERTDGSPPRPHDEEKLGKSVRIVSLKVGEPAVLSYVDDPTCTLWTPEVVGVDMAQSNWYEIDGIVGRFIDRRILLECEGITYEFENEEKVGEE